MTVSSVVVVIILIVHGWPSIHNAFLIPISSGFITLTFATAFAKHRDREEGINSS